MANHKNDVIRSSVSNSRKRKRNLLCRYHKKMTFPLTFNPNKLLLFIAFLENVENRTLWLWIGEWEWTFKVSNINWMDHVYHI